MVVLSAAVTLRGGKVILARQFVPMTRIRVESLLAAFPKLIGSNNSSSANNAEESSAQHTFIETENVRYLYQPIEGLYVVLITNKASNIKEDLDTLRMFGKLIPEYCNGHDEEAVSKAAFQLVFALDELISVGYKEYVTLSQIRTFTDMDSHEEKLQNIIRESKETEQRHLIREQEKRMAATRQGPQYGGRSPDFASGSGGFGSQGFGSAPGAAGFGSDRGGFGGGAPTGFGSSSYSSTRPAAEEVPSTPPSVAARRGSKDRKGMDLKGKKKEDAFGDFGGEAGFESFKADALSSGISKGSSHAASAEVKSNVAGVHVVVEERLALALDRDGVVKKIDIRGELKIVISDPDFANVSVKAQMPQKGNLVRYTPKPALDKKFLQENQIRMKGSKGFAVGRDNANGVLKWRIAAEDESLVPIQLTVWPSEENGKSVVSAEYNGGNQDIIARNVFISIPCFSKDQPSVSQIDGDFTFDPRDHMFTWHIDEISSGSSGSLEFSIKEVPQEKFFPVQVTFNSDTVFSGVIVDEVIHAETNAPVDFSTESMIIVEEYVIQ